MEHQIVVYRWLIKILIWKSEYSRTVISLCGLEWSVSQRWPGMVVSQVWSGMVVSQVWPGMVVSQVWPGMVVSQGWPGMVVSRVWPGMVEVK